MMRYALVGFVVVLLTSAPGAAQDGDSCTVLCAPELKIAPTISFENLGSRARVESELNLDLIDSDQTGGWRASHLDIVDKFSPAERPDATSAYTHKLNFELDTALRPFNSLPEGRWLRNLETEVSIDYVATGIPKAGDDFGDVLYLDDESPWSLSLVLVLPLAPLNP